MNYYLCKILLNKNFNNAIEQVTAELKKEGFGILTEIDLQETFSKKLNVKIKKYKILGACNPHFAYKALQCEDKIGALLPCNVVVEELNDGRIEISIVDPIASMSIVKNEDLVGIANEVKQKLTIVIDNLN